MSFLELLAEIEKRPDMYISKRSIENLKVFLDGYTLAQYHYQIEISSDWELLGKFQEWVQNKYNIRLTQSWANILLFHSPDEFHALDLFFQDFKEFLAQQKKYDKYS